MVHCIVLFGLPGCEKGSIAQALQADFNLFHISSGDIIRKSLNMGRKVERGNLLSDEIIIPKVFESMKKQIRLGKSFILDGFPRNCAQAMTLNDFFNENNVKSIQFELEVTPEMATTRMLNRGRKDDNLESIKKRLNIFYSETYPAIKLFKAQDHKLFFTPIDANRNKEHIIGRAVYLYKSTLMSRLMSESDFYEPFNYNPE
jgi:adenylate kinase